MEKFSLFRTGIDAITFLLSNKDALGICEPTFTLTLGDIFEKISEEMSNEIFRLTDSSNDA